MSGRIENMLANRKTLFPATAQQCTLEKFTLMCETSKTYDIMKPLKEPEVVTVVNRQVTHFWVVMMCSLAAGYQLLGVIFCFVYATGLSKTLATRDCTASHLRRQQCSGHQMFEMN
jgi:hypothetical protein